MKTETEILQMAIDTKDETIIELEKKLLVAVKVLEAVDSVIGCGCGIDGPCKSCSDVGDKIQKAIKDIRGI